MQSKRITVIQSHRAGGNHYGHALARAYIEGAQQSGHEVRMIEAVALDFTLLRSQQEWNSGQRQGARARWLERLRVRA